MNLGALLFGLAFGGVGAYLLVGGVGHLRHARAIRSNDPVPVRELAVADDPLEFEGRVELPPDAETFEARFSGEPAVCYQYRIREKRSSGGKNNRSTWRTVDSGGASQPFVVADGSARVELDPDDATLGAPWETVGRDGSVSLFGGALTLDVGGGPLSFGSRPRRYQERRLEPGDDVHVYGASVTEELGGWDSDIEARIGPCAKTDRFRVTVGDEGDAFRSELTSGLGRAAFGALFAGVGVFTLLAAF